MHHQGPIPQLISRIKSLNLNIRATVSRQPYDDEGDDGKDGVVSSMGSLRSVTTTLEGGAGHVKSTSISCAVLVRVHSQVSNTSCTPLPWLSPFTHWPVQRLHSGWGK